MGLNLLRKLINHSKPKTIIVKIVKSSRDGVPKSSQIRAVLMAAKYKSQQY